VMKKLQGTARADRRRDKNMNAKRMPKRPTGLSEQAVRIWKSLGPKLHELGLLAETDASTFAIYCQAFGDWLQLTRYLNRLGPLKWYSTTFAEALPEEYARVVVEQRMRVDEEVRAVVSWAIRAVVLSD
jgi:hypothetical protein